MNGASTRHRSRHWPRRVAWSSAGVLALLLTTGLLWISCGLLVDVTDFTSPVHRWRHRTLIAHGVAAYAFLWLAGLLLAWHQGPGWPNRLRRRTGAPLAALLLALACSGLGLYYPPSEELGDSLSLFHQIVGGAIAPLLLGHLVCRQSRRAITRSRAGSRSGRNPQPRSPLVGDPTEAHPR